MPQKRSLLKATFGNMICNEFIWLIVIEKSIKIFSLFLPSGREKTKLLIPRRRSFQTFTNIRHEIVDSLTTFIVLYLRKNAFPKLRFPDHSLRTSNKGAIKQTGIWFTKRLHMLLSWYKGLITHPCGTLFKHPKKRKERISYSTTKNVDNISITCSQKMAKGKR